LDFAGVPHGFVTSGDNRAESSGARGWRPLERSFARLLEALLWPCFLAIKAGTSGEFVRASSGSAGAFGSDGCGGQGNRQDVLGASTAANSRIGPVGGMGKARRFAPHW
jgi:hypothetical protein